VRSKSRGGDVISSQEISMVAADNSGPTIEFPSRNERAEELMASDIHCAGEARLPRRQGLSTRRRFLERIRA